MAPSAKQEEVQRAAETLYAGAGSWVTFYRQVLGLEGVVRRTFHTRHSLSEFEQTEAYQNIQRMLRKLRQRGPVPSANGEATHVITVRLPKSLHEALVEEAHEHRTTLNKLCISKLLQFIDNYLVPASAVRKEADGDGTAPPQT